ncbi:tetratricopeptide repeat protein [Mesocricetibacter intestinalis]|uniref:Tetratricopeptide repeat protein n=1 Tax=Mesocricetibacter intestinalis TaxID=1521930 RepID=A0A4R6VEX3_9PAST|nr:tetratricopeptide repeat protein [Mesocricetibacter intestinalis]TDQ59050.1 tetratricopeptide repeat protein [Mesocricetibacter intestinalis]
MKILPVIALSLLLSACSSMQTKSNGQLGNEYYTKGEYEKAKFHYQQAIKEDDQEGTRGLGLIALQNNDIAGAEKYFLRAYNNGFHHAGRNLGWLYIRHVKPRNCQKGLYYLISAAQQGSGEAIWGLKRYFNFAPPGFISAAESGRGMMSFLSPYGVSLLGISPAYAEQENKMVMKKLMYKCENLYFEN